MSTSMLSNYYDKLFRWNIRQQVEADAGFHPINVSNTGAFRG